MPEYMVLIHASEAEEAAMPPSETHALIERHSAYERTLRASAAYLDGERLRPSAEGKRIGVRDGQPRVESGPFADAPLAGYYVVQAESLDAATALAEECPMAPGTPLDVRPVMKGRIQPDKTAQQGRVFAFAVLGSAPSEQGWIDVMDRIDAVGTGDFPAGRSLGGVRLHAPGRGRRVTSTGGKRTSFDGPFLESKEVIGGVFFLRMATLEEAVTWAGRTEFVKHGPVEIRELWRS
jgi:hypothetical protein